MPRIITHSDSETKKFGKKFASTLRGGDIVCLSGELGAGKTTLVKGIAEGLGVKEEITSPTFTLMNVYEVETTDYRLQTTAQTVDQSAVVRSPLTVVKKLIHIDMYRLKNAEELIQIGVEDYLGAPDTITVVEWPEKMEKILRGKKLIKVTMEHWKNSERKIRIEKSKSIKHNL